MRWTDITQTHIKQPPSEVLTWRLPYKHVTYVSAVWRISLPSNPNLLEAASNGKLYICSFQRLLWKRIAATKILNSVEKKFSMKTTLEYLNPFFVIQNRLCTNPLYPPVAPQKRWFSSGAWKCPPIMLWKAGGTINPPIIITVIALRYTLGYCLVFMHTDDNH